MSTPTRRIWTTALAAVILPFTASGAGDTPIVSPSELHQHLVKDSQLRQQRVARLKNLFSSDVGRKALAAGKTEPAKVLKAVAMLSDDELARLAATADKAQADFAAGALSNQELTYIVIALGTAVLILVIVVA